MNLLAQAVQETSRQEIKDSYGSLIFVGAFFLALIFVGIWWLKRQA
jgi:hypothetical protein